MGKRRGNRYFEVRPSAIQGRGGYATRPLPRGTRVIEYLGERITHAEADARYDETGADRHHTFLFAVDRTTVIDAAVGGNAARFLNHSCEPNCVPVIERGRVFLTTLRDVEPGEELTYDYAYARDGDASEDRPRRFECRCGARRCRGSLLSQRHAR